MASCLEQVFSQPLHIAGVSSLGFFHDTALQMIERVLEKRAAGAEEVSVGVGAPHHVAEPKDQKQISVDAAVGGVSQVGASSGRAIFGREGALFAKSAGGGEALASFHHPVE